MKMNNTAPYRSPFPASWEKSMFSPELMQRYLALFTWVIQPIVFRSRCGAGNHSVIGECIRLSCALHLSIAVKRPIEDPRKSGPDMPPWAPPAQRL